MGFKSRAGTFAGAFRKKNPLSDGVAKPSEAVSQFCVSGMRSAYLRTVPKQDKEGGGEREEEKEKEGNEQRRERQGEERGVEKREGREGQGGGEERNESC